jgi:predicted metal-dependent HD superfamily phosphohydrolase
VRLRLNEEMDPVDLSQWWPPRHGEELRDALVAAYDGAERGYHDRRHLAEVLGRLDELAAGGEEFVVDLVRLAAWFHDAVYDGTPGDEARSAAWAEQALPGLGLSPEEVAEVARLVRLTEDHRPAAHDCNGCALSDADLAILAAPADRYEEYVDGVRREYAAVPEKEFRRGRAAVLRELRSKPSLFHTAHARAHWEDIARANLDDELARLEGSGDSPG